MQNFNEFSGCNVLSCARQTKSKKERANYLIEETCRYADLDVCIYKPVSYKYIIKE